MNLSLVFAQIFFLFSVERVEFEMAVLKQRKIDGERRVFHDTWTDQYFFIAHTVGLICSEISSSIPSDLGPWL